MIFENEFVPDLDGHVHDVHNHIPGHHVASVSLLSHRVHELVDYVVIAVNDVNAVLAGVEHAFAGLDLGYGDKIDVGYLKSDETVFVLEAVFAFDAVNQIELEMNGAIGEFGC